MIYYQNIQLFQLNNSDGVSILL